MSDNTGITSSSMEQSHSLGRLLSPSMWSGFLCLIISLVALICTVGQIHYRNGDFYRFFSVQPAQAESSVADGYGRVVDKLDSNKTVSYMPLLIFWAATGMIVYWFTMLVFNSVRTAMQLRREVEDYVHVNRRALIMEPLEKTGIRLIVLAVLYGWLKLTFGVVIPYFIALAYAASGPLGWQDDIKYLAIAFVVLAICLHGFVVLARALLLRPRVFSPL